MFCPQCGTRNANDGVFCSECGKRLAGQAPTVLSDIPQALDQQAARPQPAPTPQPSMAQNVHFTPTINVSVAQAPAPTVVVVNNQSGTPLVIRALWFVFFGLWLGAIWMIFAWLLDLTIIGLPFGLMMLNRVPQIMTLRPSTNRVSVQVVGGATVITTGLGAQQVSFPVRAVYFLLIGIWFSGVWMFLAWCAAALIITLPIAFWMFDRVPAVTTLRRT